MQSNDRQFPAVKLLLASRPPSILRFCINFISHFSKNPNTKSPNVLSFYNLLFFYKYSHYNI